MKFDRRKFIELSACSAGFSMFPASVFGKDAKVQNATMENSFAEPPKTIPIAGEYDVIVCGGGPAGIAAAISSARSGVKTLLVELGGCLGGVWTSGLLTFIFDFNKSGITEELKNRLDKMGAKRNASEDKFVYAPEPMKLILEEMCAEAGVDFLLHTRVVSAYKENNRLTTIATESKSGREAWKAKAFIDASGDGDLGALAGNGWDIGHGGDTCPCQPLTLNALAVIKDPEGIKEFLSFYSTDKTDMGEHAMAHRAFKKLLSQIGINPSYGHPTLFPIRDNLIMMMVNHEYNIKAFDARAISEATVRARAEIHKMVRELNKLGAPWDGLQLVATADHIGVRDGRRLHGRFTLTREDLVSGARFDDAVTGVTFGVDIHAHSQESNDKYPIQRANTKMIPYDIPLRALIAKDVEGLMMAGRCISGDFIAHASYRVTGNAVAMGEAAGVVSAASAQSDKLQHEVEWEEISERLSELRQK